MKKLKVFAVLLALISLPFAAFGQDAGNEAMYLRAIQANPNNEKAHYNLGITYLKNQKFQQAITEFEKCLQLDSKDADARANMELCQGIIASTKGDYVSAVNHYQNTLKINPNDPNAKHLLPQCQAKVYMDQKKYTEAIPVLNQIIQDDPKNFSAYQNLGFIYFQQKSFKEAVESWNKSLKFQEDSQIYKYLGFSYYNLGDFNNAINSYKKSIKLETAKDPKEQDKESLDVTFYNLGVAYLDNASYDEAADAFGNAFKANSKDSDAALAQANAIQGAVDNHLRNVSNYMLNSQYADAISEANKVLKYQSDNKQAQAFINDARDKLNVEVDKHFKTGKNFYQQRNTLQALNEWNLALKMDPNNEKIKSAIKGAKFNSAARIKALIAEGDEYYQTKDYSNAMDSFIKAKQIDPRNSLVKARLKKLITKQSSEKDSVYSKAIKYYSKGELKNALKYISMAKEIAPNDETIGDVFFKVQKDISVKVKALDAEGVSLFGNGDKKGANAKFQEVLKLNTNDETANDYVKRMTGQQSQVKVDAENVKALYYEGVNLYINGKIHEAIAKWQECLKHDPNNLNAQSNINKAMVKLQSIEKLSRN